MKTQRIETMKYIKTNNLQVIDEPLDAIKEIRLRSRHGHMADEAFYICNISDIINKHKIWKRIMPRVIPYYAVKCNDSAMVIQTLALLGANFDCASKGEIKKVISHGVAADSIIYAQPTKPISHLNFAAEMGVRLMTFDSDYELYKIHKNYPAAELVLRIRYDAKVAHYPLGAKYGCNPDTEAPRLIELAKSLQLNLVGISFHVGSGCEDAPIFASAIRAARKLFDFAVTFAAIINSSLELHFPLSNVKIIAEPGQYYVASAYTLACQIHSKREIYENGKFVSIMYFINDGTYGSFSDQLHTYKHFDPITLRPTNGELLNSSIWGPTCDALDQVCKSVLLPRLDIDDFIIFEDMGAYTISISTNFNGFPLARVEYFIERKDLEDLNDAIIEKI